MDLIEKTNPGCDPIDATFIKELEELISKNDENKYKNLVALSNTLKEMQAQGASNKELVDHIERVVSAANNKLSKSTKIVLITVLVACAVFLTSILIVYAKKEATRNKRLAERDEILKTYAAERDKLLAELKERDKILEPYFKDVKSVMSK